MIALEGERLTFRFPEVHRDAVCSMTFQRTPRASDDGRGSSPLPERGSLPLYCLEDYTTRLPRTWRDQGGVMMPMDQAEAMWLDFAGQPGECGVKYPFAVKVAVGRMNAVTGEVWSHHLNRDPQDYLVIPEQPWLDSYCAGDEGFRQFAAAPPGIESFPETEVAIGAETAVLQILVFPIKAARYRALVERKRERVAALLNEPQVMMPIRKGRQAFSLTPGRSAEEQILDDPHTLDAWDQRHASRCYVIILNAEQWMAVMGERLPTGSRDADLAGEFVTEGEIPRGYATSIEGPFDAAGPTSDPASAPSGRVYRRARKSRPVREAGL